jgi:polyphosphate kinase
MPRNIDRRVELLFPVEQPDLIRTLKEEVLDIYLADTVAARQLLPDGRYERVRPRPGESPLNSQVYLLEKRQRG